MINILFNKDLVAVPNKEAPGNVALHVEPFESFGSEYGMFIPMAMSGYVFLRWLRRGMKDDLPKDAISSVVVHISNDGEVILMSLDSDNDCIGMVPVTTSKFTLLNASRDTADAYTYLIKDCKTISEAVKIVDDGHFTGMYDPHIILAEDWVKHAKEKGYRKTFMHTRFKAH